MVLLTILSRSRAVSCTSWRRKLRSVSEISLVEPTSSQRNERARALSISPLETSCSFSETALDD
jgi:hypothetical protein